MKPIDLRNATWLSVLTHVTDDMLRVHNAWLNHGPGTTRQVAERSGISILTLRPRTTELYQLGLVALVDSQAEGQASSGIYRHVAQAEAMAAAVWQKKADFRKAPAARTYATIEQALQDMSPIEQAALGARLMGKFGHLTKRRDTAQGSEQLSLLSV